MLDLLPYLIIAFVVIVLFLFLHGFGRATRTRADVVGYIERFLNGSGGERDWDDFISVAIKDSHLDAIRLQCARLRDEFPPLIETDFCGEGGVQVMQQLHADLRSAIAKERRMAADLARDLLVHRITEAEFARHCSSSDDKDVEELLNLLQHQPPTDSPNYQKHMAQINGLIQTLST